MPPDRVVASLKQVRRSLRRIRSIKKGAIDDDLAEATAKLYQGLKLRNAERALYYFFNTPEPDKQHFVCLLQKSNLAEFHDFERILENWE